LLLDTHALYWYVEFRRSGLALKIAVSGQAPALTYMLESPGFERLASLLVHPGEATQ